MKNSNLTDRVAIIDFGSQYTRIIARRLREMGVFCLVYPANVSCDRVAGSDLKGIILSGGAKSVSDIDAPLLDEKIWQLPVPMLGVCYGHQLMAKKHGGVVGKSTNREYGLANLSVANIDSVLFRGIPWAQKIWMSHGDHVDRVPDGFSVVAGTETLEIAAMENRSLQRYGIQFHPEVSHTEFGKQILKNYIDICKMKTEWESKYIAEHKIEDIRRLVGKKNVVLGLSGGVDSSVAAALISRAIGNQLHCVFVDHGLLRKNEMEQVKSYFKNFSMMIHWIDAKEEFFKVLSGVTDPEEKRKRIGETFVRVFEREARKIGADFLAQGTTYPDVIESSAVGGAVLVKTHHNVGGLPEKMKLQLLEPLRELFKDEVRKVGAELGLSDELVYRHPFPGPGLAIRIPGEVTPERVKILQEADDIFTAEIRKNGFYRGLGQAFAVLLPIRTVGIMGDERTYEYMCALRAVTSEDFMTADWAKLPHEFIAKVANRIVNEVRGINRVVYDVTSKPPATIEYE